MTGSLFVMVKYGIMSFLTPPTAPQYRVTLFYGPDLAVGDGSRLHCVFNVKKRSWKAGIQVAVELSADLIADLNRRLSFDSWLESVLGSMDNDARREYRHRAQDLLVVHACTRKLTAALNNGLPQENTTLSIGPVDDDLPTVLGELSAAIKQQVLVELDLAAQ
ncbi:MAG: hypothetical protein NW703_08875 [Nitrospiraceae bacterium]